MLSWTHIYQRSTGKYRGFFTNLADAKSWLRKQDDQDDLEISDERPVPSRATPDTQTLDTGLDAAIAAAQEAHDGTDDAARE